MAPLLILFLISYALAAHCKGPIQNGLRYNSSNQPPVFPGDDSLASQVCCGNYNFGYPLAEARYFFQSPGTLLENLEQYKNTQGQVTFYDSVCGLPLFLVPVGRSMDDFIQETKKHGWPSFRPQEIIGNNVIVNGSDVISKCGTYLGTTEDEKTDYRFCLDLVCVSGNPVPTPKTTPSKYIDLVTFNPAEKKTFFNWKILNDPVMGGQSNSTLKIDRTNAVGIFNGSCKIVPKLNKAGFCNAETDGTTYNNISGYTHIMIYARTRNPNYPGYKISICADAPVCQFFSFKANFNATSEWSWIAIPFGDFSDDWSSYTGNCQTVDPNGKQHYCCSQNSRGLTPVKDSVCMTPKRLARGVQAVGLWTQGYVGEFQLEVKSIGAGIP